MTSRVYVGGISYRARERDIEHFLGRFGKIREISLKSGFCFVDFDDHRDAEDAVYELNGRSFMGDKVKVEIAKGTPHGRDRERFGVSSRSTSSSSHRDRDHDRHRRDSHGHGHRDRDKDRDKPASASAAKHGYKVRVLNLSSRITWQDLRDYMQQAGEVVFSTVDGSRKHEGVVEYAKSEFVRWAMNKLDGTEINGRKITLVDESKGSKKSSDKADKRSRSKSKTKSRSRSRSRSEGRSAKKRKEADDSDTEEKKENGSKMDTSDDSRSVDGKANGKEAANGDGDRARRKRSDEDDTDEEED